MADDETKDEVFLFKRWDIPAEMMPLFKGMQTMYETNEFTDLTITCEEREWKVHKNWLCAQSKWFRKACAGDFKEAADDKIALNDDHPEAVEAMLQYLYYYVYASAKANGDVTNFTVPLILDVRVFAIADKYFIEPLKTLAAEFFAQRAKQEWNTDQFAAAIAEVYSIVPEHEDTLRLAVIGVVKNHAGNLFDKQKGFHSFRKVSREIAEFADDVSEALATDNLPAPEPLKMYECPQCHIRFSLNNPSDVNFGCPRGCHRNSTVSWWSLHMRGLGRACK